MPIQPDQQSAIAIIPARYESSRFPGKPLMRETGKYLIQHVYERAQQALLIKRTIVATDDERIFKAVRSFGGEVVMTRSDHPNGTSRLAEAAALIDLDCPLIVNVQGDEPEIDPDDIDLAVLTLIEHGEADAATLASSFAPDDEVDDPNIVKVVIGLTGNALYFSRALIPYVRNNNVISDIYYKHLGLYVYRREFLTEYVNWSSTPLEETEQLEQLRILEHGRLMAVAVTDHATPPGIDTPEQYADFVERRRRNH